MGLVTVPKPLTIETPWTVAFARRDQREKPRCKKCPVVWKQLETAGYAERTCRRDYHLVSALPKSAMATARAR